VPIAKLKDMKRKEEREESGSIHSILWMGSYAERKSTCIAQKVKKKERWGGGKETMKMAVIKDTEYRQFRESYYMTFPQQNVSCIPSGIRVQASMTFPSTDHVPWPCYWDGAQWNSLSKPNLLYQAQLKRSYLGNLFFWNAGWIKSWNCLQVFLFNHKFGFNLSKSVCVTNDIFVWLHMSAQKICYRRRGNFQRDALRHPIFGKHSVCGSVSFSTTNIEMLQILGFVW
jgi:hypothetical protein